MRQSIVINFINVEEGYNPKELYFTAKIGYLNHNYDYHFTFTQSGLIDHDAHDELEAIKKSIHAEIRNFLIEKIHNNFDIENCQKIIEDRLAFVTKF
jgi:hypothetical protein